MRGFHNTKHNTTATGAAHQDHSWWRLEARRVGTDCPVLALHVAAVVAWRARHDQRNAA